MKHKQDLGASHTGFHDWYWQRISAAFLLLFLPILFGLMFAVYTEDIDFQTLQLLLTHPFGKTICTIFVLIMGIHIWTGLKVICEDYLHTTMIRVLILNLLLALLILMSLYFTYYIWAEASYTFSCISCVKGVK